MAVGGSQSPSTLRMRATHTLQLLRGPTHWPSPRVSKLRCLATATRLHTDTGHMESAMITCLERKWEVSITQGSCKCSVVVSATTAPQAATVQDCLGLVCPTQPLAEVQKQHQLTPPAPKPPSPRGALGDSQPPHHRPAHIARNSLMTNAQSHTSTVELSRRTCE